MKKLGTYVHGVTAAPDLVCLNGKLTLADAAQDRLPFADSVDVEDDVHDQGMRGIGLHRDFVARSHMSEHAHPTEKAIARMGRAKTSSYRQDHRRYR